MYMSILIFKDNIFIIELNKLWVYFFGIHTFKKKKKMCFIQGLSR